MTLRPAAATLSAMKIVVADKISERGIELLRESGWQVVLPAAARAPNRNRRRRRPHRPQRHPRHRGASRESPPPPRRRPRRCWRRQRGHGCRHSPRRPGDEHARRQRRQRRRTHFRADAGSRALRAAIQRRHSRRPLGKILHRHGIARQNSWPRRPRPRGHGSRPPRTRPRNESPGLRPLRHPSGRPRTRRRADSVGRSCCAARTFYRSTPRSAPRRKKSSTQKPSQK